MPEHTSEKAEVKMYSDFKSPYVFLAFDPGMGLGQRFDVRVRDPLLDTSGGRQ